MIEKKEIKFSLIGMPINLGCDKNGVEEAPTHIRQYLKSSKYNDFVKDRGDVECKNRLEIFYDKYKDCNEIKFFDQILMSSRELSYNVQDSISQNTIPIVCGGDHVSAYGSIAGVSMSKGVDGFAVIYIDAHGDFNTEKTSPSGNMHGMHMAFLTGFGHKNAVDYFEKSPLLRFDNIYFIGTRALDSGEKDIADKNNAHIITSNDAENKNIKSYVNDIIDDIQSKKIKHIHVSLDIDAIDPSYAPGTGVPERRGMHPMTVMTILKLLLDSGLCKSFDLVEFNPLLDKDMKTEKIFLELFDLIIRS